MVGNAGRIAANELGLDESGRCRGLGSRDPREELSCPNIGLVVGGRQYNGNANGKELGHGAWVISAPTYHKTGGSGSDAIVILWFGFAFRPGEKGPRRCM